MANSYVAGKWSGTLSANLKGDASKTTPTLGDDFDSELNNLKKARTNVKNTINAINKEIKLLKNHAKQQRNTSRSRFVTANGQTKTIAEWSEITGIK